MSFCCEQRVNSLTRRTTSETALKVQDINEVQGVTMNTIYTRCIQGAKQFEISQQLTP